MSVIQDQFFIFADGRILGHVVNASIDVPGRTIEFVCEYKSIYSSLAGEREVLLAADTVTVKMQSGMIGDFVCFDAKALDLYERGDLLAALFSFPVGLRDGGLLARLAGMAL